MSGSTARRRTGVEGGTRRDGLVDDPDAHNRQIGPCPDLPHPGQRQAVGRLGLLRGSFVPPAAIREALDGGA